MCNTDPDPNVASPLLPSVQPMPFYQPSETTASAAAAGVWPPTPQDGLTGSFPSLILPLKFIYRKVVGHVSDLRDGRVEVSANGIGLFGRALPRAEVAQTILIILLIPNPLICLIAGAVIRYACLRPFKLVIGWSDINEIVLDQKRKQIGIAYKGQNQRGIPKVFSLCTRADPADFAALRQSAEQYAPTVTHAGRLRSTNNLACWIFCILFVLGLTIFFIALYHPLTTL